MKELSFYSEKKCYQAGLIPILFILCVSLACTSPIRNPTDTTSNAKENSVEINQSPNQTADIITDTKEAAHKVEPISATNPIPTYLQATQPNENLTPIPTATDITPQALLITETKLALPGFSNLTDFFTDPDSGWPENKQGPDQWWYAMEHYHIKVGTPNNMVVIPSSFIMSNGSVITSGLILEQTLTPQAYFGVVCRYQDPDNFYFFDISPDGLYRIGKIWNGTIDLLGMTSAMASPHIKTTEGNQYNLISVECRGNQLSLLINDQFVQTVTDNSHSSGQVGLCASAGQVPEIIAAFKYFFAEE